MAQGMHTCVCGIVCVYCRLAGGGWVLERPRSNGRALTNGWLEGLDPGERLGGLTGCDPLRGST